MEVSTGPRWPFRFLLLRRPWSRAALAWSAALHALGFTVAWWTTRGAFQAPFPVPVAQATRADAVQLLVLESPRPETRPAHRPERRHAKRGQSPAQVRVPASPPSGRTPDTASPSEPAPPSASVQELAAGDVAGVGRIIATPGADTSAGDGILGKLGFRVPGADEIGPSKRGLDRVVDLVTGASSACPELRPPSAWARRALAVAVAFVVDTNGKVDRGTLRVVESPGGPQTDRRYHSRIYVVGATVHPDRSRVDPAGYDTVVTSQVASHAAELVFRPALKEGRAVRSSVLISCQAPSG